jgi:hypothetical protein
MSSLMKRYGVLLRDAIVNFHEMIHIRRLYIIVLDYGLLFTATPRYAVLAAESPRS